MLSPTNPHRHRNQWREKNRERSNEWHRKYYQMNKEKIKKRMSEYRLKHPDYPIKYRLKNKAVRVEKTRELQRKAWLLIQNEIKCVNCGCNDERIIEVNHKNGDGSKERKKYPSVTMWRKIIKGERGVSDLELTCIVCNALDRANRKTYSKLPYSIKWCEF